MKEKIEKSILLIEAALDRYKNVAVACSFGKDSIVTVHLVRQVDPDVPVVFLDTHYKFPETIAYKEYMKYLWNMDLREYSAPLLGMNLYDKDYDECCQYYKVDVLKRAIKEMGIDCWISGMRATEGQTRRDVPEWQEKDGLMKLNPILDFTESEIYLYHLLYNIPINPLYFEGYRSLGCAPCTKKGGTMERDGRWAGTKNQGKECGIHCQSLKL